MVYLNKIYLIELKRMETYKFTIAGIGEGSISADS
jgi:hypothetical protein